MEPAPTPPRKSVPRHVVSNLLKGVKLHRGQLSRKFEGPPALDQISAALLAHTYSSYGEVQVALHAMFDGGGTGSHDERREIRDYLADKEKKLNLDVRMIIQPPQQRPNPNADPLPRKRRKVTRVCVGPRRLPRAQRAVQFHEGQTVEVTPDDSAAGCEQRGFRLPDAIVGTVTASPMASAPNQISVTLNGSQWAMLPGAFHPDNVLPKPPATPSAFPSILQPNDRVQVFRDGGWYDASVVDVTQGEQADGTLVQVSSDPPQPCQCPLRQPYGIPSAAL